jgi:hypothetical protein
MRAYKDEAVTGELYKSDVDPSGMFLFFHKSSFFYLNLILDLNLIREVYKSNTCSSYSYFFLLFMANCGGDNLYLNRPI